MPEQWTKAGPATRRRRSLRLRLVWLVAACIAPLLCFSLGDQYLDYRREEAATGQQTLALAHVMSLLIDEELDARIAALRTLAVSRALRARDLDAFRDRAEAILAEQFPGSVILLLRDDGQQMMNTAIRRGEPLPIRSDISSIRRVIATGLPAVSNVFDSAVDAGPVVAIDVPVKDAAGTVTAVLSINPRLSAFRDIIRNQNPAADWVISIVDRAAVTIARVPEDGRFVGHTVSKTLIGPLLAAGEGVVETNSLEGIPLLTAFSHAGRFGWGVAIGVPLAELRWPAAEAALRTLTVGGLLAALGLALAFQASRQIARPIASLRRLAASADRDLLLDPPSTGLRETDDVVDALKAAERNRREAEQLAGILRDGIETIPAGFVIYDDQDRLVLCNQSYRDFFPETADQLVPGTRFEDILRAGLALGRFPGARGREVEWLAERLRVQREPHGTLEQQLADGRWVFVTKSLMPNGFVAGLRVDISALKTAEQALRDSEAQLRHAQRLAQMGSFARVVRSGKLTWSEETYRLFGVSPDNFVPSLDAVLRAVHPNDRAKVLDDQKLSDSGVCPPASEFRVVRPDGAVRHLWRENGVVRDEEGAPYSSIGTLHDITARRQIEAERDREQRALERSNEDLAAFAYIASHDLKAPLRAIMHLVDWIDEDIGATASVDTLDNLRVLRGRAARLQMLLDGLLTYSRVGREEHPVEDVDTARLVRDIVLAREPPVRVGAGMSDGSGWALPERSSAGLSQGPGVGLSAGSIFGPPRGPPGGPTGGPTDGGPTGGPTDGVPAGSGVEPNDGVPEEPPKRLSVVCEGEMPVLRTRRAALRVVLENLIDNGVRHHDRDTGRITVSARVVDGRVEFRVSDDGPGIPKRFHDRIFQIFQTLAARDDLETSGIGLAIAKKRVLANGGEIWVESEPPTRGATFVFTWAEAGV